MICYQFVSIYYNIHRYKLQYYFLFDIKIEAKRLIDRYHTPPSMNPIQALQSPTSMSHHFVCPPAPRASQATPSFTWSGASSPASETTFSWGATPTWTLPPPQNRSGAAAPTGTEPSHNWSDLQHSVEPESLRHLTTQMVGAAYAILPSQQADDIIHPDIKHILIRQRGSYWWEKSQAKLEQQFSSGERQPVQGGFYVFLEEEQLEGIIIRFGNVLTGACWRMQTVAFPKGHPDADVPPYQMIDVRE